MPQWRPPDQYETETSCWHAVAIAAVDDDEAMRSNRFPSFQSDCMMNRSGRAGPRDYQARADGLDRHSVGNDRTARPKSASDIAADLLQL